MRPSSALGSCAALLACLVLAPAAVAGAAQPSPTGAPAPREDPQSVVVEVPTYTGTDPVTVAPGCPELTREDFVYTFTDEGVPPRSTTVTDWTAPVRLTSERPPLHVTITLRDDVEFPVGRLCRFDFSLGSYDADGPTPETAGELREVAVVTGGIDAGRRTLALAVPPPACAGQIDLWLSGTGGGEGPSPLDPARSIATWNGDRGCLGAGADADLQPVPVASCPGEPTAWRVVNPNGRAVSATTVITDSAGAATSATLLLAPGATPVTSTAGAPLTLSVSWSRSDGSPARVEVTSAAALDPSSAEYAARCGPGGVQVSLDKSARPVEGSEVRGGTRVRWTIVVANAGPVPLDAVEVVDVLPAALTRVRADGAESAGGRLTWRFPLQPGRSRRLTYSGTVRGSAVPGQVLANTAIVPAFGLSDTTVHTIADRSRPASPAGAGPAGGPGRGGGPLARTGAVVLPTVVAGLVAMAAGALVVVAVRRRRPVTVPGRHGV